MRPPERAQNRAFLALTRGRVRALPHTTEGAIHEKDFEPRCVPARHDCP